MGTFRMFSNKVRSRVRLLYMSSLLGVQLRPYQVASTETSYRVATTAIHEQYQAVGDMHTVPRLTCSLDRIRGNW